MNSSWSSTRRQVTCMALSTLGTLTPLAAWLKFTTNFSLGSNQLCSDLFNDDTECLIPSENNSPRHRQLRQIQFGGRRLSQTPSNRTLGGSLFSLPQPQLEPGVFRSLNYPAFQSLRIERVSIIEGKAMLKKEL